MRRLTVDEAREDELELERIRSGRAKRKRTGERNEGEEEEEEVLKRNRLQDDESKIEEIFTREHLNETTEVDMTDEEELEVV